ncbi:MAG: nucleotidyltransferase domain-containing protein [Candidatus Hydrothermarchaeales archaeon]
MVKKNIIKKLRSDFSFLFDNKDVLALLIFGSHVKNEGRDFDICIVAPECKNKGKLVRNVYRNVDIYKNNYDVWLFEELPIYMRIQVIESHEIIYTREKFELYEYFYFFRKLWKDQEQRQKVSKEEILKMLP